MPYPAGHRAVIREKIVDSARKLFNQHGFDSVSVRQIMAAAGLTHGGFYDYFRGKSDLYTEVLGCFFTDPNWKSRWEGVDVDPGAADVGAQIVRAYLSRQHYDDVENSCPMVALPTDVRRSGKAVKGAFETVFLAMVRMLEQSMDRADRSRHHKARAVAALCIGGVVVARALRSETEADDLRKSCMQVALELASRQVSRDRKTAPRAKATTLAGRRSRGIGR
jgi:TetR/AcrR family transcriptional regulator, transcriptional repressor for nem operon